MLTSWGQRTQKQRKGSSEGIEMVSEMDCLRSGAKKQEPEDNAVVVKELSSWDREEKKENKVK